MANKGQPNRMKILKKRVGQAQMKAEAFGKAFDKALVAAQRLLQELALRAHPDPGSVKRARKLLEPLGQATIRPLEIAGRNVELFFRAQRTALSNDPQKWIRLQLKKLKDELGGR